jgi:condensin complex subunit 2
MEEISTSFCFICLLHLANEQGLKLESDSVLQMDVEGERKVGDIWDVKVCIHVMTILVALES